MPITSDHLTIDHIAGPSFYFREDGTLWEMIGYIDRPAALLRKVERPHEIELVAAGVSERRRCDCTITVVADTPQAAEFTRLVVEERA